MNYKYFTSPPLIFMSKRQTINVTFVSLMSTIILLFTQSHASPKPCVGCHHSWDLQLLSKGGPASTIRKGTQAVIGWRYLRTYWPQIKPSQSRNSNTINECGVRRETGDWPHAPPWPRSRVWEWELDSEPRQWQLQALDLTRDTWRDVTENVKWHKPTLVCLSPVPSLLDY